MRFEVEAGMRVATVATVVAVVVVLSAATVHGDDGALPQTIGAVPVVPATPSRPPPLLWPVRAGQPTGAPRGKPSASFEEGSLRRATDGSGDLLYEESGFSARVTPDGSVTFRDKRLTILSLLPFLPVAGPRNVPSLQSTIFGLARNKKMPVADERAANDSSFLVIPLLTPYRPDGREACRECKMELSPLLPGATGTFDLTDEMIRLSGQDPYRYQKARFLVATRDLRVARAARARAESVRRASVELPRHLREIACDTRRTVKERRQIIEKLKDELDGTTPEALSVVAEINRFLSSELDGASDGGDPCPAATETAPASRRSR